MNTTRQNGHVNPARYCEGCDDLIHGEAHHHDGDLLCPACWAERRAEDARTELEEAETEIQDAADALEERRREYEQALAELDCEYSEDLAELRRRMSTWQRRANAASKRLRELGSIAAAVGEQIGCIEQKVTEVTKESGEKDWEFHSVSPPFPSLASVRDADDPFGRVEQDDAPWLEAAKARGEEIPAWCRPAPPPVPTDHCPLTTDHCERSEPQDRSIPAGAVLIPPELEGLAPVCGGADFTPTDDDWSDYRSWAEACDRREAFEEPEPEQPLWGYEA